MKTNTEDPKTIEAFCATEQMETSHVVDIDSAGEVTLTCECGRFIKLPAGASSKELKAHLSEHKKANEGRLDVEKEKAKLLADL